MNGVNQYSLHILQPISEHEYGGADMHVLELCNALKESNFSPVVLIRKNNRLRQRFHEHGIPCFSGSSKRTTLAFLRGANKWLKDYSVQIVHSHGYDANYYMALLKILYPFKWKKIPTVITSHGWIETNLRLKFKTWLDLKTHIFADAVIVCSKTNLNRVKKDKNKIIRYIPNGIDTNRLNHQCIDFNRFENIFNHKDRIKIAFVGRLSSEKRVDLFLKLASRLSLIRKDISFYVVGAGKEKGKLVGLAAQLELANVFFTGLIEEVEEVYKRIDLLILPSDTESTPRVILEAFLFEKPVIASDVGSVGSIIDHGQNGYLFRPGNLDELYSFALKCLDDVERNTDMGKCGKRKVLSDFTIERMKNEIEKVYNQIIL